MSDEIVVIELEALSEERIAEEAIEYTELWMIKTKDGQMHGPFDTESIKNYAADNEDPFEDSMAYNLSNETWKSFFKVAKFQRRKPKLVPMQSLMTSDNFIVLFNGEKKGPFTLEQIQKFVDDKKIALNIQVSLDDGESWIKLFEHHAFDRRLKKNAEDLPFVPEGDVFNKSQDEANHKAAARSKVHDEEDAIVGLAFMSNGNDKGQILEDEEQKQDSKKSKVKPVQFRSVESKFAFWDKIKETVNFKYVGGGVVVLLIAFTAMNSFNSSFNNDSEIKHANKEIKTKKESINNSARVAKKQVKRNKPAKIARARKYQPKPQKRVRPTSRRPAQSRRSKRETHTDDRFEVMDIDDPRVKEELTRELAGNTWDDEYEELSQEQRDFIERANEEGMSEGDFEDMERRDDQYDMVDDFE